MTRTFIALLLAAPVALGAQAAPPQTITFDDAIRIALRRRGPFMRDSAEC